jgi:hypothetical protein
MNARLITGAATALLIAGSATANRRSCALRYRCRLQVWKRGTSFSSNSVSRPPPRVRNQLGDS